MRLKKHRIRNFLFGALILFISSAAITVNHFEISKNLDIFATAYKKLNNHYVGDVDPGNLMYAAIKGMLKSLDPYTVFYSEESINDARIISSGDYAGIGASLIKRDSLMMLTQIYDQSPAQKAGLNIGDMVLSISGVSMVNKTTDDARELLNGQEGSEIEMIIKRMDHDQDLTIPLTRKKIKINDISHFGFIDSSSVAYIKLESFTQDAGGKVKTAFLALAKQKKLDGLILDLRGNGGGLLIEAVNIVNMFIDKDLPVVLTKGRTKDRTIVYKTKVQPTDLNIPIVVLVNKRSASASEIVAGAIQDYDRGIILGQKSFGKGLVQNVMPLSYKTSMKITVAKYYIPSGRCIQSVDYLEEDNEKPEGTQISNTNAFKTNNGRTVYDAGGIIPDIVVEMNENSKNLKNLLPPFGVFDYATHYFYAHDSITSADEFTLKQDDINDFIDHLSLTQSQSKTKLDFTFDEFKKQSIETGLDLNPDLSQLKDQINQQRGKLLLKNKLELKNSLSSEIIRRYYGRESEVKSKMSYDKEILKAKEIIYNQEEYRKLLGY